MLTGTTIRNFSLLMLNSHGSPNEVYFAKIFASWFSGVGILPERIGLGSANFQTLMHDYFNQSDWIEEAPSKIQAPGYQNPEKEALVHLFLSYRRGKHDSELWLAEVMASGCLGQNHLWQDLGLWCRCDLTAMIRENFPSLFSINDQNMRWKKFFYKQLCAGMEIIYTCKSPTCQECADYNECFGPEE